MTGEPSTLSALLHWYRAEVGDDIPIRIVTRAIDEGGAPQWHGAFRAWLTAPPDQEDKEGNVISPLRYWLHQMGTTGRAGRRARFLFILASIDFDWNMAARIHGIYDSDAAHDYTRATLGRLWRLMYSVGKGADGQPMVFVNEPRREVAFTEKSESQVRAEDAA